MIIAEPGVPIEQSSRGSVGAAVFVQDQTTDLLDVPFLKERTTTALASATAIDDRVVNLDPGHGTTAGEVLEIAETGTKNFIQSRVLSVATDAVTIDQPVNRIYAENEVVVIASDDMLVDGSVTPQVFSILPLSGQKGDMVRIIMSITSNAPQDFSTFGSAVALTNGCVLRVKKSDGTFKNIFNWKSNGDFIERAFDGDFLINNGNNVRAFYGRRTFGGQSKNGVVIRLEGSLNEELQIVIQDDLVSDITNLTFRMHAQGHELQE
jgi:hypothetical protein